MKKEAKMRLRKQGKGRPPIRCRPGEVSQVSPRTVKGCGGSGRSNGTSYEAKTGAGEAELRERVHRRAKRGSHTPDRKHNSEKFPKIEELIMFE